MCRMAMMNKTGIDFVNDQIGDMELFLDTLESSMGGHGNGYALILNGGKVKIKKGVRLSNKQIIEDVEKNYNNIKYFIYHTRLASIGTIVNSNCHPFRDENTIICMNGTESWAKAFSMNNETDTETILKLCKNSNMSVSETVRKFGSAFLGYENQKVFASRGNGSLQMIEAKNDMVLFASEFPYEYYFNYEVGNAPKFWIDNGTTPRIDNVVSTVKTGKTKKGLGYSSKRFSDDFFDQYVVR